MLDNLTKEQVQDIVDSTLAWGSEVSELWTGTQYEKQIDLQKSQLLQTVESDNLAAVEDILYSFAHFLHDAEEEYARV